MQAPGSATKNGASVWPFGREVQRLAGGRHRRREIAIELEVPVEREVDQPRLQAACRRRRAARPGASDRRRSTGPPDCRACARRGSENGIAISIVSPGRHCRLSVTYVPWLRLDVAARRR